MASIRYRMSYRPAGREFWFTCTMPGVAGVIMDPIELAGSYPHVVLVERMAASSSVQDPDYLLISASEAPDVAPLTESGVVSKRDYYPAHANLRHKSSWDRVCTQILTDLYNGFCVHSNRDGSVLLTRRAPKRRAPDGEAELSTPANIGCVSRADADAIMRELREAAGKDVGDDASGWVRRDEVRQVLKDVEQVVIKYLWRLK